MRMSRRQLRRNEQLMAALESGGVDPETFFNEYTPFPTMADFGFFQTPLSAAREVVEHAEPMPHQKILDFGAGLGVFSYVLLESGVPAENISAVEFAMEVHEIGTRVVPSVSWVQDDACCSSFWKSRMGRFDLVIGNPPWGKTKGRAVWGMDDTRFGDFILAGDGNGRKAAAAEAMALESALRVLRPGGKVVFLLPAMAFKSRSWARYNRDVGGPYEASREFFPFDVTFARPKVSAGLATIVRNDTPFPGQVSAGGDETMYQQYHQQYQAIKARYPEGTIVLFRLGDFYEAFGEDAKVIARELDLVLTSRPIGKGQRAPMACVPYHVVEGYVTRLIEKGYHVALAEQIDQGATLIEEPKVAATPESEVPEEADPTGYEAGKGSAFEYIPSWMNIPALYENENKPDPLAVVKLFTPDSSWTWYITEYDGDNICFGLVVESETELGYFSLAELEGVRGKMGLQIERDLWFHPMPVTQLSEYLRKWGNSGPYQRTSDPARDAMRALLYDDEGNLRPVDEVDQDKAGELLDPFLPEQPLGPDRVFATSTLTFDDNGAQVYFEGERYIVLNPYLERDEQRYGSGWVWHYRTEETDGEWRCLPDPDAGELSCIGAYSLEESVAYAERITGEHFEPVGAPDELPDSYPVHKLGQQEEVAPTAKVADGDGDKPWQLTRRQYQEREALTVAGGVPILNVADAREHERIVREALESGETVPACVLADYPDLSETDHKLATVYRDWLSVTNGDESAYPSVERLSKYQKWAQELLVGGSREEQGEDFRCFCRVHLEGHRLPGGADLMVVGEAYRNGQDFPAPEGWPGLQESDETFHARSWEDSPSPRYPCVRCGREPDQEKGWLCVCGVPVHLCPNCQQKLQIKRIRKAGLKRNKLPDGIPVFIEVDLGHFRGWADAEVVSVKRRWLHYRLLETDERRKVQLVGRDILWREMEVAV